MQIEIKGEQVTVQASEDALKALQAIKPGAVVSVHGYTSSSSGDVVDMSMVVGLDYKALCESAVAAVGVKTVEECVDALDSDAIDLEVADKAKQEVVESFQKVIDGESNGNGTPKLFEEGVPGVKVSKVGTVLLNGILLTWDVTEQGEKEKKVVKSRPKTIAKRWFEKGTCKGSGPGGYTTVSLGDGKFVFLSIAQAEGDDPVFVSGSEFKAQSPDGA